MLETLHLTKIYKTKGGADVKALDDVCIQFPEKGMVFLLGKSGSGKSTLLNVCGGLDSPTSGAIIVKGRSSNAFSQSDFDSYRNTFVGFIFQEYNILNEFTVEDNIALALELQGKPKDKKVIAQLLEQVDLAGFAKRKPNTLSGGQKQRIAIARALVKSPEIIMADEPTGALDSETGKQVFDTLKKLSKDKLVIVVSHDRDFAETYGDRIIELKDGKVISDVTKTQEEREDISSNISVFGDTLCVRNGAMLSETDFEEIKNFLQRAEHDVIIATGEQEIKNFKETNHIREDGGMEVFRNSEELPVEPKQYRPEDSRFIRSKLPMRHAVKIGVSSMKTKPIRLAFTILLCTVAFIFFGMLSTMTFYDSESTFKQSLQDSGYTWVKMGKAYEVTNIWNYQGESNEYSMDMDTKFTDEELKEMAAIYGENTFGGVSGWYNVNTQSSATSYWMNEISSMAYLDEENSLRQKITGTYPQNKNEICISSYTADVICNCKAYDKTTGQIMEVTQPEDILGKQIEINGTSYTVVGIFDSGKIPEQYEMLKESERIDDYQLYSNLYSELQDGLHMVAFVSKERLAEIALEETYYYGMDEFSTHRMVVDLGFAKQNTYRFPEWSNAGFSGYTKNAQSGRFVTFDASKTEPGDGEVIISLDLFCGILLEYHSDSMSAELQNLLTQITNRGEESVNAETGLYYDEEYTDEELDAKIQELVQGLIGNGRELLIGAKLFDEYEANQIGEIKEYKVIGIWIPSSLTYHEKLLFNDATAASLWETYKANVRYYDEYISNYVEPDDALYSVLYLPYDASDEVTDRLWTVNSKTGYDEDGSKSVLSSNLITNLKTVDIIVQELSKVFLYVGLVLAVFAALLLSNFISVSISYKKREIGILRAVGARSIDVFKIFFSESFVITAICVVASLVGSIACCALINGVLVSLIRASLFVFGPLSLGVLLAVAFVTAVVATFLPVWNAAKKKPVESIRAL